jgi:hypothetical protein
VTGLAADPWDLVGAVQGFGLFSAAAVVDRYVEIVDRTLARVVAPAETPVADTWLRLLVTTAALFRSAVPREAALVLPPARAGHGSEASLWLHNTTSSPAPAADLHVTGLVPPGGDRIAADAVSLLPARVGPLAAGASREVRLRVQVPAGQAPAQYHGVVVTSAAPEPLALRLEVRAP